MITPEERAKNRAYYLKHREKILARAKEKYQTDPALKPRLLENWRVWAKKHPDKLREHHKKYVENNKEKIKEWQRKKQQRIRDAKPPKSPKPPKPPKAPKPPKIPKEKVKKVKVEPVKEEPLQMFITGPVILGEDAWA